MEDKTLLIFLVTILVVIFWNFIRKSKPRFNDQRSDYSNAAVDKLRGNNKPQQNKWRWLFQSDYERRVDYYRNEYLKSDAWKRKRYVVLTRDNWRCVYCGSKATQVHHKKYARKNIGKEPIEWLVSVCRPCHEAQHR